MYVEEKPVDPFSEKGRPYLIESLSPLASGEGELEDRVSVRKAESVGCRRSVRMLGSQFVEFVRDLPENQLAAFGQGLLLLKMVPALPELLVTDHGGGLLYTSQIIRHARMEAGLSQEEFASRIGTRYRNLTPSEIGSWILNLRNLCRILNALGLRAVVYRPVVGG